MGDLSFEDCLARQEGLSDKKYVREHKQWFKRMKRRKVRAVCRRLAQNAVVIVAALIPIWICFQLAIEAKDAQAASEYYLQEWQEAVNGETKCVAEWCETIDVSQFTVYWWIREKGVKYAEQRLSEIA